MLLSFTVPAFRRWSLLAALLGGLGVSPLHAASRQVELGAVADTTLRYSDNPPKVQNYLNFGASLSLSASRYTGRDRGTSILLRFDLSSLPAGAIVRKATLQLTASGTYLADIYLHEETLRVHQIAGENEAWEEGSGEGGDVIEMMAVTVPGANAAYLNMESYRDENDHSGVRWLNGASFGEMDRDSTPLGSFPLADGGLREGEVIEIPLDPASVGEWLINKGLAQAGLWVTMTSREEAVEASRFAIFMSKEVGNPPQLVLEYDVP